MDTVRTDTIKATKIILLSFGFSFPAMIGAYMWLT
jgi:hypothetical protein